MTQNPKMTSGARLFGGYRPVKKAQFDAPSQHRRSMIAKVHVAKKQLLLSDDDYRQIMFDVTGEISAAKCTDAQLLTLIEHFKSRGFAARPARASSLRARPADHPAANKARALWISLYHLNAIGDPAEQGLESFARRQLKCEKLQWADQSQMFKLIEALKAIGIREGWDMSTSGAENASHALKLLKRNLIAAQLIKLKAAGYAGEEWSLSAAVVRIAAVALPDGGVMALALGDFDMIARVFGYLLRTGVRR